MLKKIHKEKANFWKHNSDFFKVPHSQKDYQKLSDFLDSLIDESRGDEKHPYAQLIELIGVLMEKYEDTNIHINESDPVNVLKYLMNEHNLSQADLSDIGSQGVVSEILRHKRKLNLRQIKLLSRRFKVSPEVFITMEDANAA